MFTIYNLLVLAHLVGLSLGVGSATIKLALIFRCNSNNGFFPTYFKVSKLITQFIITGMILLTLSGIGWIITGYSFDTLLTVKVILVGMIWLLGPIIDNLVEPKLQKSAPLPAEPVSPAFVRIMKQYLALEITATALMYIITILGILL